MKFAELFIRRPVFAIVFNLVILAVGWQSVTHMAVRQYPELNSAVIRIVTTYTGANAELVRGFITTPLEHAISSADGIDYIQSTSSQNQSVIDAHLRLNHDNNAALAQITARVNAVRSQLPPETESPVIEIQRVDNARAMMYLSFESSTLSRKQLTDYMVRSIQPMMQTIPGMQKAEVFGGRTLAMRVWLRPERLAGYNLSPQDVQAALARNNYVAAIGQTKGSSIQLNLSANTDLHSVEDFQKIPLRLQNGSVIRLGDVADIELGAESYDTLTRHSGIETTFMAIFPLPSANSLDLSSAVRKRIDELRPSLPAGVTVVITYDEALFVRDALTGISKTLAETLLIVSLVIYVFLGSLRSVLVPLVAIPISLIGAASLMLLFGFSINLLTILAVILSVGLVVDDAIVVAENIERHIRHGMTPIDAALKGARELTGPIIAMTITLAAVYAPIAFQGGLTGILFREFALTLAGSVFISGIVALTLSPIMSAKLLTAHDHEGRLRQFIDGSFNRLRDAYGRALTKTLKARQEVLIVAGFIVVLIVPFYFISGKELAPQEDRNEVLAIMDAPPETTIDYRAVYAREVEKALLSDPDADYTWQTTTQSLSMTGLVPKPWGVRHRGVQEILMAVYPKLNHISGVKAFPLFAAPLPSAGNFDIEMMILSEDSTERMADYARQLADAAAKSGLFMYADTNLKIDRPQTRIVFDRDKLAAMGIDMQTAGRDLAAMLGGNYVNRFNLDGRSYEVIPQISRQSRLNTEQLNNIYITGPDNKLIPVSSVATLETTVGPRQLDRFQQRNAAQIFGGVLPGMTSDAALEFLEKKAREILPPGYTVDYAGSSRQLRTYGNSLNTTLIFAIVLIYLVLAAQFSSFRDPFIILLGSAPLAISGALLFTFLGMTTINIYSQIGLITLVGLVSKNGILIVQFANQLQEQGIAIRAAIHQAAITRLRPILITSAATVLGHFPLVLVTGAGAEARNSIGIILVAGMTIGTLFTLFIVPTLYMLIARDLVAERKKHGAPDDALPFAAGAARDELAEIG